MGPARLAGLGLAGLYIAFLIYVAAHMAMGFAALLEPISIILLAWGTSPVVFLAWRLKYSLIWLVVLVPIVGYGTYAAYEMAFISNSSTSALGWLFLPLYQWVFIGLVGLGRKLIDRDRP